MQQLSPQQKNKLISIYPELRQYFLLQEIKDKKTEDRAISEAKLVALINKIQILKGDKGEDGYTPVKGKDYFTNDEIDEFISNILEQATPVKGVHYDDGEDGHTPTTQELRKLIIPLIPDAQGGKPGKDGSPDKPEEIATKLNTLKGVLDISVVDGAVHQKDLEKSSKDLLSGMQKIDGRVKLIDQRWHSGGLSKVSTDATLTGNGTPASPLSVVGASTWYQDEIVSNGSTGTSFNLNHTPLSVVFLYKNGQYLVSGNSFDYTRSGVAITLSVSLLSSDILTANYS